MLKTFEKKRAKPTPTGEGPKQKRHPKEKQKRIQTAESWLRQVRAKRRTLV